MANAYASVQIPMFKYFTYLVTVDSSNNTFVFRDDGATDITCTIPSGEYTWTGLAYQIRKQMRASTGVAVYTVRYRVNTRIWYFASDLSGGAVSFQIRTGHANDIAATLGITGNKTGASSYDGDSAVPGLTTLTFTQKARLPRVRRSEAREDLVLDSGASESSSFGATVGLTFYVEHESVATIVALYDMLVAAAGRGQAVRYYPDSTNTTDYVDVFFTDRDFDLPEESDLGMYRYYGFSFTLREVPVASQTGTLNFRSFLDRRPNS